MKNFIKNIFKKTFSKKLKLITHDGSFHTDDIFAAAVLSLYLEKNGKNFEIIRTRDEEIIKNADYIFDVGGIYDPEKNRFDHHQKGGAGKRQNGIEYASIGLVWKKFGVELCDSQKAVDIIDQKLIVPIDAGDNGIQLSEIKGDISPYFIQSAFNSFNPDWKDVSNEKMLAGFLKCVEIAREILKNEIIHAENLVEAEEMIDNIYKKTQDKRIIILDKKYPYYKLQDYLEPLYVIYPRLDKCWGVEGVAISKYSFEKRKNFPEHWAGLRDKNMQESSGVSDAIFCHRALFLAVAKSKEGAMKLAKMAVEN